MIPPRRKETVIIMSKNNRNQFLRSWPSIHWPTTWLRQISARRRVFVGRLPVCDRAFFQMDGEPPLPLLLPARPPACLPCGRPPPRMQRPRDR